MSVGNRLRIVVLVVGLVVAIVGFALVVPMSGIGPHYTETTARSFAAASFRAIDVESFNGPITYELWDGDDIAIEAVRRAAALTQGLAERALSRVAVHFTDHDGRVGARVDRAGPWFLRGYVQVRFVVRVPRSWAGNVSLTTKNGSITTRGTQGDVVLNTSNGTVIVDGHVGSLQARSSNGSLRMTNIEGIVQAGTSNGAVRLTNAVLSGSGRVSTSNGSVVFDAQLVGDAHYDATTSNGSVTVTLADPDAMLNLRTSNGQVNLHTEVIVSTVARNHVQGRIGSGTAQLNVRTSNGSINFHER